MKTPTPSIPQKTNPIKSNLIPPSQTEIPRADDRFPKIVPKWSSTGRLVMLGFEEGFWGLTERR